jgi:hypothetical protein
MNRCRALYLLLFVVVVIDLGWLAGCDKDDTIQRYQVAKTSDTPAAPDPAIPGDMPATPADASQTAAPIHWTVPASWKQLPGNNMRYASFAVSAVHPELELSVVPLGGTGGSLLSNINRWEGQIGLPASSEDDLKKLVTRIDVAGTPVDLFDRTGAAPADHTTPKRIIAAIVAHGDRTWFFKLSGPADQLQNEQEHFRDFVRSIRFDAAPDAAQTSPADASPVIANAPSASAVAGADTGAGQGATAMPITFSVPAGWQQEPARDNSIRVVGFSVANGSDTGEAVVTRVTAGSGTMIDNVNRWRGQVELDPITSLAQDSTEKLNVGDRQATIWDFDNSAAAHRMIVAMITVGDNWWFFKLSGPPALVAAQKAAFTQFVTSVKFRGAAGA